MAECDHCGKDYDENESWMLCSDCMDRWFAAGCPMDEEDWDV